MKINVFYNLYILYLHVLNLDGSYVILYIDERNVDKNMPIKPTEMERIILADGWIFKNQT